MAYHTVLVHVDTTARAPARIRVAAQLVRASGGHLFGAALTGVSRLLYQRQPEAADDPHFALHLAFVRERAIQAVAAFRREAEACALPSFEGRVIDDEAGAGLSLHARAADLVVLGQAPPDTPAVPDFCPHVLLHAGRPVLLLPAQPAAPVDAASMAREVLVAWDASRAAGRALLGALPLLRQAGRVCIVVFDEGGKARLDAMAADPLPFLARHQVRATLEVHALGGRRTLLQRDGVGAALLALAAERHAGLLVMGAYGHSRMRETILGGATRSVLAGMRLPVLMDH